MSDLHKFFKKAGKVAATGGAAVSAPFLIPRVTEEVVGLGLDNTGKAIEGVAEGAKGLKDFVNTTPAEAATREFREETGNKEAKRDGWRGFMDNVLLADKDRDFSAGESLVSAILRIPDDTIQVGTDTLHGITHPSETPVSYTHLTLPTIYSV